jgi:hypothetical protein
VSYGTEPRLCTLTWCSVTPGHKIYESNASSVEDKENLHSIQNATAISNSYTENKKIFQPA